MTTATPTKDTSLESMADLLGDLGDIPPGRVRMRPIPGEATEKDVVAFLHASDKRLCELVHGVLVEKAMGTREALLASLIVHSLWEFLETHDLGIALGGDGAVRLRFGLVRIPDVSFKSLDRLPGARVPEEAIASIVPDLAVEVVSEGNTEKEMFGKLHEYFEAGVLLVWLIYPKTQTAKAYTSPAKVRRLGKDQALSGGAILPGFNLPLKQLFARAQGRRPGRKHG